MSRRPPTASLRSQLAALWLALSGCGPIDIGSTPPPPPRVVVDRFRPASVSALGYTSVNRGCVRRFDAHVDNRTRGPAFFGMSFTTDPPTASIEGGFVTDPAGPLLAGNQAILQAYLAARRGSSAGTRTRVRFVVTAEAVEPGGGPGPMPMSAGMLTVDQMSEPGLDIVTSGSQLDIVSVDPESGSSRVHPGDTNVGIRVRVNFLPVPDGADEVGDPRLALRFVLANGNTELSWPVTAEPRTEAPLVGCRGRLADCVNRATEYRFTFDVPMAQAPGVVVRVEATADATERPTAPRLPIELCGAGDQRSGGGPLLLIVAQ